VIVNNSLQVTTQRVSIHMMLEIQVLAWDSQVWRGYINWLMGSPTDINKQYKPAQIRYHSKSPHTIINMNDNMNMWYFQVVCTWHGGKIKVFFITYTDPERTKDTYVMFHFLSLRVIYDGRTNRKMVDHVISFLLHLLCYVNKDNTFD
jgi:hypothetical protein